MCGIFGIVSKSVVDPDQFCQLGEVNKRRGNLAFGYFIGKLEKNLSTGNWVDGGAFRYTQPFEALLVSREQAQIMLGHIRAQRGGSLRNSPQSIPLKPRRAIWPIMDCY